MQGFIYVLNNLESFFMNINQRLCNVYKQKVTNELYETLLCNYISLIAVKVQKSGVIAHIK